MSQTMNISQISSNARQILMENQAQKQLCIASNIESLYSYLVIMNRDRVVCTLITAAMGGKTVAYINFDYTQFCCYIGRPSEVLRNTLNRIIKSDVRLVGVTFSVWRNKKNTVEFRW